MCKDKVIERIEELKIIENYMNEISQKARVDLAGLEEKTNSIRKIINDNDFSRSIYFKELEELKITLKHIEQYETVE